MSGDVAGMTVIIPANNEEIWIGDCLTSLALSHWDRPEPVQVIVVANGCSDDTVGAAALVRPNFKARGWKFEILDRAEGNKLAALNAGDAAATGDVRVYVDADVRVGRDLLTQLLDALDGSAPLYASGRCQIAAEGAVARAYARVWRRVPFMRDGVPGCGVFAMNAAGRARWNAFPCDIISDDTFARLHFAPSERIGVTAGYRWPIAEGWRALIKVRRRQDAGVDQIAERYPQLLANNDTAPLPHREKLALALRDPLGFAVYSGVALASRLTRTRDAGWSRGR